MLTNFPLPPTESDFCLSCDLLGRNQPLEHTSRTCRCVNYAVPDEDGDCECVENYIHTTENTCVKCDALTGLVDESGCKCKENASADMFGLG